MPLYSREDAEIACIEAIEHARAVNNTADKQYKIEERHRKAAKRICTTAALSILLPSRFENV